MKEQFQLNTKYTPSVDQSIAIDTLTNNLISGKEKQVLLGVTGSGKTFVMANVISKLQIPTLVL